MAKQGERFGQQGGAPRERGPGLQVGLGRSRTDLDDGAVVGDLGAAWQPGDVDEHRGLHQPHVEHRHQRLAAGEQARVVPRLGKGLQRLLLVVGAQVVEGRGLHRSGGVSAGGGASGP